MTKILGLSGKKQSGKDTTANFILGAVMKKHKLISGFNITDKGKLHIDDFLGCKDDGGIFDYDSTRRGPKLLKKDLEGIIKLYSFADFLKEVCMKMFGLTYQQCYGTDEQKNSLTALRWEDMPGVITDDGCDLYGDVVEAHNKPGMYSEQYSRLMVWSSGKMSARQVLQFTGTEIFRKMYPDCHVNATHAKIKEDNPEIAIIRDTRFVNEVEGTLDRDGLVLRFLRDPNNGTDKHASETSLDDYPQEKFSFVLDNRDMGIEEQNIAVANFLNEKGWNI
jgi:hypothetical protein